MKIDTVSNAFDALSQVNRLKIFRILVEHSKDGITPTEIADLMGGMPRNTLSFHLSLLTNAELCTTEKNGKQVIYKPKCDTIKKIVAYLLKDCCDGECKC